VYSCPEVNPVTVNLVSDVSPADV
jgi:hypothetical protein